MQVKHDNRLSSAKVGIEENTVHQNPVNQKNLKRGLDNAFNLLHSLEQSLQKSSQYEDRLLQCQKTHFHSHNVNEWWGSESEKSFKYCTDGSKSSKSSRAQVDPTESWSTMSIVCLQYQYEELSRRYEALLRAYDEKSKAVSNRDASLMELRHRIKAMCAELAYVHKTLLAVGKMYCALKEKGHCRKTYYKEKISRVRAMMQDVIRAAENSRQEFDERLSILMSKERNSDAAVALEEMRRRNMLFMENMKLKAQLEDLVPGSVHWN